MISLNQVEGSIMDKEVRRLFEDVAECVREINERISKLEVMCSKLEDEVTRLSQDDNK